MKELITSRKFAVILSHKGPDGDSIGSSLALSFYLSKLGLLNKVIIPDEFPHIYNWIKGADDILCASKNIEEVENCFNQADLIFCLDFNHRSRVGELISPFLHQSNNSLKIIVIDHHTYPENFGDYEIIDPNASSTCELIYDFIKKNGDLKMIDANIAQAIYLGLVTDTGSFKFSSTTAHTHQIASDLLVFGIDHSKIQNNIYDQNSLSKINLLGYALQKIKVDNESPLAYLSLSEKELKSFNYKKGDTDGFVNYCLSLKDIEVAVFLRQDDNMIKISFRSKGLFKVNEFSKEFYNGGGHEKAAGGSVFDQEIEQVEENLIKNFRIFCLKNL
tara:strand:+ start:28221 stop:29216 length:996 start_codon:yes stop_codon:yes gene_type:complete